MSLSPSAGVHLCIVQPLGYVHSMGLLDAAFYFRHRFEHLGASVTMAKNRLRRDAPNLVFGAHLGFDPAIRQSFPCIFVNLEQLGEGGSRLPSGYLELLRGSPVIDYDAANCRTYTDRPDEVPLICFGYAPYLRPPANAPDLKQRPIDLLFFGSMNERRQQLIDRIEKTGRCVTVFDGPVYGPERDAFVVQSRAVLNCHFYESARFEQVRAFHVLSLGTPVVSEHTDRTRPGAAYERSISWFTDQTLEAFFSQEYCREDFLTRAALQLENFRNTPPLGEFERALNLSRTVFAASRTVRGSPCLPQRLLHIGSGKDYRPGWLNIDVLDTAQPDLRLDLCQPQTWPARFESPFWGSLQLQAGATDLIFANNVLEHVPDLPMMMGNCLDLLRCGGLMVIEVPYEKDCSAWQDPTHVRAMNENSWLYYTDWFWYLGWFEYRFKLREFKWLDRQFAPCAQSAAAFMSVTLEKVPTTIAERMTARTMRPDFGGLLEPVGASGLAVPRSSPGPALAQSMPAMREKSAA